MDTVSRIESLALTGSETFFFELRPNSCLTPVTRILLLCRHPDQIFVWWSAEPPGILLEEGRDLEEFDNFFNWTWTYRRSSDVTRYYGNVAKTLSRIRRGKEAVDEIISSKTNLAVGGLALSS